MDFAALVHADTVQCVSGKKAVADDSGYEDEADGWSVVGRGRARSVRLKSQAETSGHGGRFAALSVVGIEDMEERKAKCSGEVFFECDCDDPKFSFELRSDRRIRQQERRKQEGQQRKGRTARKRVKASVEFKAAAVWQSQGTQAGLLVEGKDGSGEQQVAVPYSGARCRQCCRRRPPGCSFWQGWNVAS